MTPEVRELMSNLIEWAAFGLVSVCCGSIVGYMKGIRDSIVELNKNVAVIITKMQFICVGQRNSAN